MPDNETLSAVGFFLAAILAGLWGYFKKPPAASPMTTAGTVMTAAIGMGWMEKDQAERMLTSVEKLVKHQERMAEALEALADRRASEMKDTIDELMDVMREKERRLRDLEGMRARPRRARKED